MPGTNDFKPFSVGGSANVIDQATYAALNSLLANGFVAGVADSAKVNKVLRQSSIMAAAVGDFIASETGEDVIDDGTTDTIKANLISAINSLIAGAATSSGRKNLIVDGACRVSQSAPKTLTTSSQYGAVDMFSAWGAGSAVSAGNIAQGTASPVGQEGYSLYLSGVTITGAGEVHARHRIESAVAREIKNKTASFSVQVYHDVGSPVDYTVIICKATAVDNFTSTTSISTSSAQAVPNAAGTLLTFSGVAMGDCSNGVEIEVKAACGAVTSKNFHFTEWQLEAGAAATSFERTSISESVRAVERYLEKTYDLSVAPGTVTFTGAVHADASQVSDVTCVFRERKRATPTVTFYSALSGASGSICYQNCIGTPSPSGDISVSASRISTGNITVESLPGDGYMPVIHYVADARL